MSEKIKLLTNTLKDVIQAIEGADKTDGPLGVIYTVHFTEARVMALNQVLDDTDSNPTT